MGNSAPRATPHTEPAPPLRRRSGDGPDDARLHTVRPARRLAIGASADPLAAWLATMTIYGGAAHLAVLGVLAQGSGWPAAAAVGLLVNARLIAYAAAMAPQWRSAPFGHRAIAALMLTDAPWALSRGRVKGHRQFYLGAALTLFIAWPVLVTLGYWRAGCSTASRSSPSSPRSLSAPRGAAAAPATGGGRRARRFVLRRSHLGHVRRRLARAGGCGRRDRRSRERACPMTWASPFWSWVSAAWFSGWRPCSPRNGFPRAYSQSLVGPAWRAGGVRRSHCAPAPRSGHPGGVVGGGDRRWRRTRGRRASPPAVARHRHVRRGLHVRWRPHGPRRTAADSTVESVRYRPQIFRSGCQIGRWVAASGPRRTRSDTQALR